MNVTFAQKAARFYKNLSFSLKLPKNVEVLNPYQAPQIQGYVNAFLKKFYTDSKNPTLVFGINPGRFGSGLTGIPFTDPIALSDVCGIPNNLPRVSERSSEFIYSFIEHFGGVETLYKNFFLTAVSPLGFTFKGKNYNYYDSSKLLKLSTPFIIEAIQKQIDFGVNRNAAILIGTGKNQDFFTQLNEKYSFFKNVYAVEHTRFIMQYRRKELSHYREKYAQVFSSVFR